MELTVEKTIATNNIIGYLKVTTVYVRYECLTVVTMDITVIWDVTPYNLIAIY